MEIAISSIAILLLMMSSMPVAISFLFGSILYVLMTGLSAGMIVSSAFYALDSVTLLAIPLFLIAGHLMEISGIAEKLINFANALVKKIKGGLAATIPIATMFFGALSGSGTAAVAALGEVIIPRLEKKGWDKRYTATLMAASGPLGFMVPPNMTAILYGVIANVSVAALFLSTIIPGIIWAALLLTVNRLVYTKWFKPTKEYEESVNEPYWPELRRSFKVSVPAFIMPIIILGGIYGGIFTPTEAGAVACVYGMIVGFFIYRTMTVKKFASSSVKMGATIGAILIIFPFVNGFTKFLLVEGVPQAFASFLIGITNKRFIIIFFMNIIFIIGGMFLSSGVMTLVLTPLLLPTANAIGLNPIQMGVIMFTAVGIGTITPPFAMNLFVAARVGKVEFRSMMKPLWPLLLFGSVPVLFLVSYLPELSLWLPRLVMGARAVGY